MKKKSRISLVKKDIEWLRDEINELPLRFLGLSMSKQREEFAVNKDDVLELINQLDEPEALSQELPTIPRFVADWIEEVKKQNKSLVFAIAHIYDKNEIGQSPNKEENKIFLWMELADNEEVFARAWLDGYEVEEEPKYRLKLNGDYLSSAQIDYGAEEGNPVEVTIRADVKGLPYHFSEDEKSYVEKYLNVEVEELEE